MAAIRARVLLRARGGARLVSRWMLCAALVLMALTAPPALAQDSQDEAKRLFDLGLSELQAGRNEEALAAFLKSRQLKPSRVNTQNAALTLKRLGRYDEALELLRRMPEEFQSMTATQRDAVLAEIEQLEGSTGLIDVESTEVGASVIVSGRARGLVPLSEPVRVNPGQHSVRIEKIGRIVASALVQVAARGRVRAVLTTQAGPEEPSDPTDAPPPKTERPGPAASRDLAWNRLRVGVGAGALLPVGTVSPNMDLSQLATAGIAVELDAGYSVLPWLELGGYFSTGSPGPGPECERGVAGTTTLCNIGVTRFGVGAAYRMTAPSSTFVPYLGLGFGYERLSVGREVESAAGVTDESYGKTTYGPRAQFGVDIALSRLFLLGPRVATSMGAYNDGARHLWVDLGVRLSFRLIEL